MKISRPVAIRLRTDKLYNQFRMIDKFRLALASHTLRQSIITSISIFLSSGLGAIFYLVLARQLGPHDYGLFSLAIAILGVVVSVADLGITQGLIRFVGANSTGGGYYPFVKIAMQWKIIMGIVVGLIFGLGAEIIAKNIFHQPELQGLLPLVGLAIFSQLLFFLSTSIYQALQKFLPWGILQVGANVLRLGLLVPLLFAGKLYSTSVMWIFLLSYLLGFGLSWVWMDKKWLRVKVTQKASQEFWHFNRWTAIVGILAAVTGRLDTLLTGRFLTLSEVGIYSLATTMVSFLPQLASAIGAVTTAKFAGIRDQQHEKDYLVKATMFVGAISFAIAMVMIPTSLVVLWITGKNYALSFIPFLILLVGTTLFIGTNPLRDSILYFHARPKFLVFLNTFQAIVLVIAGLILIPKFGVVGSAVAVAISLVASGLTTIGYYWRLKN